jgi:putative ABC transport system permease protein
MNVDAIQRLVREMPAERRTALETAVQSLRRYPLRTALTLLGLAFGVAALMATIALGRGAQEAIRDQVRAAGLNVIEITAGNYRTRGERPIGGVEAPTRHGAALPPGALERLLRRIEPVALAHPENDPMEKHDHPTAAERLGDGAAGLGAAATLTNDDAEAIASLPGVAHVASGIHESVRVFAGDRRWFTRLHGTDVDLVQIRRSFAMQHGRFFSSGELRRSSQVVVLGSVARDQLFGQNEDPIGREVTIWNQTFEVIGVVVSTNWMNPGAPGDDEFDAVYTPFTSVHRLLNVTNLNSITVTAASSGRVTDVSRAITDLLRERHEIDDTQADDFTVTTQASEVLGKGLHPKVAETLAGNIPNLERTTLRQLAATLERSSSTMSALLLAIALVSLIVGAIGISNVMLLSVRERIREIGLRMAVGAETGDVGSQFLTESVLLGAAGGVLGVLIGAVAALVVESSFGLAVEVSAAAGLISFVVALLTGVIAGVSPARRAARLDPIVALGSE